MVRQIEATADLFACTLFPTHFPDKFDLSFIDFQLDVKLLPRGTCLHD
jgi:hypothetical protein